MVEPCGMCEIGEMSASARSPVRSSGFRQLGNVRRRFCASNGQRKAGTFAQSRHDARQPPAVPTIRLYSSPGLDSAPHGDRRYAGSRLVIAFGVALAVGRARVVLLAGLVIALISAIVAAVVARGGDGSLFDFSPSEAFAGAPLVGLFLYAGWALRSPPPAWNDPGPLDAKHTSGWHTRPPRNAVFARRGRSLGGPPTKKRRRSSTALTARRGSSALKGCPT
jgi:hypothetical protein